mmetsp:Transcript_1378/g.8532  ORF Transcript_1378/g.8532 Transcript_1378/m.8532 type:complete len:117 (+) Transcript_1378:378-728(+)
MSCFVTLAHRGLDGLSRESSLNASLIQVPLKGLKIVPLHILSHGKPLFHFPSSLIYSWLKEVQSSSFSYGQVQSSRKPLQSLVCAQSFLCQLVEAHDFLLHFWGTHHVGHVGLHDA